MNCKDCEYFVNGSCQVLIYDNGEIYQGIETDAENACGLFTERKDNAVSG